jgi:anaphase-promoting complex subunit 11
MKITYNTYHAVGSWRWDLQPPAEGEGATKTEPEIDDEADTGSEEEEDEDEEEDEVEFESSCPGCKVPGDDCPLSEFCEDLQVLSGNLDQVESRC